MDYQKIGELLLKVKSAYDSIGAETKLVVEEPANIAEVEAVENMLGRKLPLQISFMNVPNGDIIAFDVNESETNPSVVYLSHDDGEGHGYILGKDFNTYLEQLLLVGACGNEDWQMLPFCPDARSGIVSDCDNAKEYRRIIGLRI